MESHVVNLQDKIQRLIDQYTQAKLKLENMEQEVNQLTEENKQLFAQIEANSKQSTDHEVQYKALQTEYNSLVNKYNELQKMIAGFETIAEGAIKKIDSIMPLVDSEE